MAPCAICLEVSSPKDVSYVDGCFHRFCYSCILQWSQAMIAVASRRELNAATYLRCPLCKHPYDSLIHNVLKLGKTDTFSRHRLLDARRCSDQFYLSHAHILRRQAYNEDYGGNASAIGGGDCTSYLWDWIVRELQALMMEEDVSLVAHLVKSTVDRLHLKTKNLTEAARKGMINCEAIAQVTEPYLFEHALRFAHEMRDYLVSGMNIAAYDQYVQGKDGESSNTDEQGLDLFGDASDEYE